VQILHDGQLHSESRGELQFTDYGLSGPVIFEVCRDACQGRGNWTAKLDFLPHMELEELRSELLRRKATNWNAEELLTGILHNRLGRVLTQSVGIKDKWKIADLRDDEIDAVCGAVKHFEAALTETMGMDAAQVTAGGILTSEFCSETMESRLVTGLYACGEVLDIDGDCGGYNLQWAWSSGRLAGNHAGGNT
jgi:predicted Rossmann fold flavoprotein